MRFTFAATGGVDAGGTAEAVITPRSNLPWRITQTSVAVRVNGELDTAAVLCELFDGSTQPEFLIEGTRSGMFDSSDTEIPLEPQQQLIVRWTGATPGGVATVRVQGEQG